MKIIRWTSISLALFAAVLVTGCGTMDMDDVYGRDRGPRDPYYDRAGSLQGTVERVNTRERLIVLNRGETDDRYDRSGLRNGRDDRRYDGDRVSIYYDDRTTVEYQGRTFAPQDLEPGDRIQVNDVDDAGDRLIAQDIQVLYDVSSGGDPNSGPYDNRGGQYDRPDPSDRPDRSDRSDRSDPSDQDRSDRDLRGTVRTVNTRDHTVEVEPSNSNPSFNTGSSGVVVVRYDSRTAVEFEGRRYEPGNLERGDVVEIRGRRDPDGLLLAEQITVVGEGQPVRR
ncbi:MAG: hypothetical protein QOF89_2349 [Acidobacteriota bacterium]|jgi:hypothetical protein|nr:hypothetical protein [Acidobacteriota bacterium]